jgi:hypothetical protein
MIKFRYGRIEVECATEEEATHVFQQMLAEDEKRRLQNRSVLEVAIASVVGSDKSGRPWTTDLFWKFIDSLGKTQKRVLSLLVTKRSLSDVQLRKLLNLQDNKELAGVLSGISKQAGANDIPARAVYKIENESKSGEIVKTYAVSLDFLRIANEMNWPDEVDSIS